MKLARIGTAAVGCGLLLILAGCTSPGTPGTASGQAYPQGAGNAIFVSKGETLYEIARRYNVPLRDLIEANGLQPPYMLMAGQRLVLPVPRTYTVRSGDTIYAISRQYLVDMNELVRLNNLSAPYTIQVGQQLRLPGSRAGAGGAVQVAQAPVPVRRPVVETSPEPAAARPDRQAPPPAVRPAGTTAAPQARGSGIETETLAPMPGSQAAAQPTQPVQPSSRPQPAPSAPAPAAGAPPDPAVTADRAASGMPPVRTVDIPARGAPPADRGTAPQPATPTPSPTAAPAQPPTTQPAAPPVETAAVMPPPQPRAAKRFQWPLRGEILSEFGSKPGGLYNDGINIAAAQGTPVTAAENGVVVYAGNELKGYGNLILVRHADGWLTSYAHLDRMEVERGQQVQRGQRLGTVGRTGNVRSPQLHFGIRRNEKALDPREHLDGRGTS